MIFNPSIPTTITFTGLSNTECNFNTGLTLSTGTAFDTSIFTFTNEVLSIDPTCDSKYIVTMRPQLVINTGDLTKIGTYTFKLTTYSHKDAKDKAT